MSGISGAGKSGKLSKKKKSALVIQRYGRGWMARHFYKQFKHIIQARKQPGKELLSQYRQHLQQIVERHGTAKLNANVDLREACDYYFKLEKYEIAFEEMCEALQKDCLEYSDLPIYFDALTLAPTKAEIRLATEKVLQESFADHQNFQYTKDVTIDIALHIYVPKGTHLQNTRKSTWLCPIVGNDDALRFELSIKDRKKISLGKCIKTVAISMRGSKEEIPPPEEEDKPKKKSKKKNKK